ncbi:MAG: HEAT repeat domain-containing protein [Verrucomicrobiales bacterium]|nr:HEAT repeat domain-containing protein [Verrucomicrobiales bacterium]
MTLYLKCLLFSPVAALILATVPHEIASAQDSATARLVPAALGVRTDRKGTSWNVEPNGTIGRIGSTMVNSGLALSIDGESFAGFQPMMTPNGKEFVIPGRPFSNYPGLQVQRRIRLLEDEGILRYAEMFYNGATDPVTLTLELNTNFSGNYQTFLTNRGRTEPVLLEQGESGIVVLPGVAQSTRAFLFTLSGVESAIKPSISAQNRYGLGFQYPLTLGPGETQIIVHQVSQVIIPQNFDRPTLIKLFRPLSFEETESQIPDEWMRHIANLESNESESLLPDPESYGLASLGINVGNRDILALGEKTRLVGEASGGNTEFVTPYGRGTIPFNAVAGIEGKKGNPLNSTKLFLRDGQVFSADVEIADFQFTQTGGDMLALSTASLDRLVMADGEEEALPKNEVPIVLIETYRGDRINVVASDALSVQGLTPWGRLPIPLSEIIRIQPAASKLSGHLAELRDGTRCLIYLNGDEIPLDSMTLGDIALESNELRSVFTTKDKLGRRWNSEVGILTMLHLTGSQRLVGDIGNSSLPVLSEGVRLDIASAKIRRIERISDVSVLPGGLPEASPSFQIERWDGGVIIGLIDLDFLSFKVREQDWTIPLRDIVRVETPSPELTPDALKQILELISQLGAPEWNVRESATRELGAFGYLAGSVLRRQLRESEDPEVLRRIERILAGLN